MSHKDPIPPELVEQINEGNCVLFVGATLSGAAGLPDSRRLGKMLADAADYPRHDEALPRIAEAYEQVKGRHELISFLVREISDQEVAPAEGHRIIARLAAQGAFSHIFTTNLDTFRLAIGDTMRPFIGVPCHTETSRAGEYPPRHSMGQSYVQALETAGGIPLLIPLIKREDNLRAIYDRLDGLFLAGGGDVDPARYHEKAHPKLGEVDAARDVDLSQ